MKIETLMWLLPVFFMIHEFEEIIMVKPWLLREGEALKRRFPRVGPRVLGLYERMSSPAMALAILEEFLLLSAITYVSVEQMRPLVWAALLTGYLIHIVAHLVQFAILRVYCPFVFSSVLSLAFGAYAAQRLAEVSDFTAQELALWTAGFAFLIALNLRLAHGLAAAFDRWLQRHYLPAH